ncbi:MAG: hypothetical protein KatS3mg065_0279 [Chloroflexota bacterium]|nr:MAG: hypothetical protein KatS3mg065_0279 [Chloroflexota bacterium]
MGPGLIAGVAGNDAGGITTYSVLGAETGLSLLWLFPITIVILAVVQEMAARLGVVTGQGLSDLIRDRFGVRWTAFAMLVLLVANGANTVAEFSGAAAALEIFGISRYLTVPVVAVALWVLVVFSPSYRAVERVFLTTALVFLAYIASAFLAGPDWGAVGRAFVTPTISFDPHILLLMVAMVGTTITPYMQFYLQSAVAEKGIGEEELRLEQADAVGGAIWTNVIAVFIVVAVATTIHAAGLRIETAEDAALALAPVAGELATRPLRDRALRGERPRGLDHADLDGLRRLRGLRLGVGGRQALPGRPDLLRDLHVPPRGRGARRPAPGPRPHPGHRGLAEPPGPAPADRPRLHARPRQRRAAPGAPPERAAAERPGRGRSRGRRRPRPRAPRGVGPGARRDPDRVEATRGRAYSGASPRSMGSPMARQAGIPFATQATCSKPARRKSEAPMLDR